MTRFTLRLHRLFAPNGTYDRAAAPLSPSEGA